MKNSKVSLPRGIFQTWMYVWAFLSIIFICVGLIIWFLQLIYPEQISGLGLMDLLIGVVNLGFMIRIVKIWNIVKKQDKKRS